jgi:hypothetical protein
MCVAFCGSTDWAGHALTAAGMVLSIGIVLYQLGKQHKSSLKLQRNNAKEELKLRVYEILSDKARAFVEADSEARSYADSIYRDLNSEVHSSNIGLSRSTTKLRANRLSKLHYSASSSLVDLIVAIENWEIAFPAAELFRIALSSANYDVENAFAPLFQDVIPLLPTDLGELGLHVPPLPTAEALKQLDTRIKSYNESRSTLSTYTHDLTVEAQNLLLSKLFKRRVGIRKPIDPSYKVVTASNAAALMHYFQTETAAGKSWEEAKLRVRAFVRDKGNEPAA